MLTCIVARDTLSTIKDVNASGLGISMRNHWRLFLILALVSVSPYFAITDVSAQEAAASAPASVSSEGAVKRQQLLLAAATLIKDEKSADAYAMLTPYESEYAGDPDFDYLLGIAALDIGKSNESIFALERVLAVQPNHLQARAEIARAYIATGELKASRRELEAVQQQSIPEEVKATISQYLGLLATAQSAQDTTLRGYLEAVYGNDSNVNSATSSGQVALPVFGGALTTLSADGVQKNDNFGRLAAGFNVRHALNPEWALLGGANINQHVNTDQHAFDTGNFDASFGASRSKGDNSYTAMVQLQSMDIKNSRYRNVAGMTGQWQRNLKDGSQASAYVQYSFLSYATQQIRNADRVVVGGAYAAPVADTSMLYFLGAYVGAEKERAPGVPHLGNDVYGARMGGEIKLSPQTTLTSSASFEVRSYGGQDPLFLRKRGDMQYDLRVGVNYVPAKKWTVSPNASFTRNNSNIAINTFDRTVLSISVRRDFY